MTINTHLARETYHQLQANPWKDIPISIKVISWEIAFILYWKQDIEWVIHIDVPCQLLQEKTWEEVKNTLSDIIDKKNKQAA